MSKCADGAIKKLIRKPKVIKFFQCHYCGYDGLEEGCKCLMCNMETNKEILATQPLLKTETEYTLVVKYHGFIDKKVYET